MKCHWSIAPAQPLLAQRLGAQLGISALLAQCVLNRGLSEPDAIRRFLEPRLAHLSDPFRLPNMDAAVQRLFAALDARESVVVFGDYDADGVTATAVLVEVLNALGLKVDYYLPRRLDEGYGLSQKAAANCLKRFPAQLLIAVDCGSTATDTIQWLRSRGVDVIVLDHHQLAWPPPPATALVNPQLSRVRAQGGPGHDRKLSVDDVQPWPLTELCSVGLAFKLAHALVKHGRAAGLKSAAEFDLRPLLELVALGTVADIVPVTGENRILVSAGLARLSTSIRPGIVALKTVAQCPAALGPYEVGFMLAPRLNAAGRLETAEQALRLLLTKDEAEADALARALDRFNCHRQKIEQSITEEVMAGLESRFDPAKDFVIVEGRAGWHIGVIGIVASRLVQRFHRPAVVIGGEGTRLRGSGRSIEGFDLAAALRTCADLLIDHGGHAMAAGLTIRPENIPALRERLNALAQKMLKPHQLQPQLRLDAEVPLGELSARCTRELDRLKPFGLGNPPVRLLARGLTHHRALQRFGSDRQHVKMWVTDGTATREAVWWGAGNEPLPTGRFDLAFTPVLNNFGERPTVQLRVADWRPATE
ncbi:MAG: single-stranded-DNA-specific exonuclease RecJ [Verrucomicrobiales bacterium]|nr:single-stranded-DNA-specific exonuclease RecJ [Verrucomicrobiales bacterium]